MRRWGRVHRCLAPWSVLVAAERGRRPAVAQAVGPSDRQPCCGCAVRAPATAGATLRPVSSRGIRGAVTYAEAGERKLRRYLTAHQVPPALRSLAVGACR